MLRYKQVKTGRKKTNTWGERDGSKEEREEKREKKEEGERWKESKYIGREEWKRETKRGRKRKGGRNEGGER